MLSPRKSECRRNSIFLSLSRHCPNVLMGNAIQHISQSDVHFGAYALESALEGLSPGIDAGFPQRLHSDRPLPYTEQVLPNGSG
jgi:hypothetical protein